MLARVDGLLNAAALPPEIYATVGKDQQALVAFFYRKGQRAAAASLGTQALSDGGFWWAVAMIPFNGALNVMVSFYLAFRVALRAHNVGSVDRKRIYRAVRRRLAHKPLSFFLPARASV